MPRSAKNIAHLANVCGFVGTDVEFQSRTANDGVHDYAFVGTMGAGLRIFDITDPAHPFSAGAYTDPGWQNDVQVRGNLAVVGFDPISSVEPLDVRSASRARARAAASTSCGLSYDAATANFTTALIDCVSASPERRRAQLDAQPERRLARDGQPARRTARSTSSTSSARHSRSGSIASSRAGALDEHRVHVRAAGSGQLHLDRARRNVVLRTTSRSHATATRMYVSAIGNDTVIVDVSDVLSGTASVIGVIPNDRNGGGVANDRNDISIAHQSDPSSDEAIIGITDERGGGTAGDALQHRLRTA